MKPSIHKLQGAALLALLLIVLSLAWFGVRQPSQAPEQAIRTEKAETTGPGKEPKESFWVRTLDDPVSLFTAILVAFTGVLAAVAIIQIRYLQRADKASVATSKIAELAAAAANESAIIAKTTLENTVRAFVDFFTFDAHHCADEHGITHISFYMTIINNGQTSTRMAVTATNWIFLKKSLPEDFSFPDIVRPTAYGPHAQKLSLGAKNMKTGVRANIPIDLVIKAYERVGHLYMWGWVEYNDVLPTSPRHRSEFAGEITVARHPRSLAPHDMPMGRHVGIRSLDTHNGSDQECYRQPGDPCPSWLAHAGPRQDLPPDHPENGLVAGAT